MNSLTFRRSAAWLAVLFTVSCLGFVIFRPYALPDWFRLRNYIPPAEIVALADVTTMTDDARHLLYVNHTALEPKATFRDKCPKYDNNTIVVGCYLSGQRGIYVLRVTDGRLNGIEQVTAAHEVLHAAYERLDKDEKQRVEKLLQNYADTKLTDGRIKAALKGYEVSEPGQQLNEMHSIFGSEIASLPPELEAYYAKYFSSRAKVVALANQYQAAFTSRQAAIKQYDLDLQEQAARIKSDTQKLKDQEEAIEANRRQLETYEARGDIEAYNAGVEPFNARIAAYNALLARTRSLIVSYNALVEERNAVASQTEALQQAIDSSDLPQSQ